MRRSRTHTGGRDRLVEPVFLLAGCAGRREALRARTRALLARTDFSALAVALAPRRLLPLIGGRALEAAPDLCPPEFRAAVDAARTEARVVGLAVEAQTRRLAQLLAAEGIRALPLKGPLLAAEAHGDLGLRQTGDVDLLVDRARLDDAARLVAGEVAAPGPDDPRRGNGLPDLHLSLRPAGRPAVELHWRVHWYEEEFSARMLARAEPGADGLLRARPDDLVASLLLYYARDGFYGVRHPSDLAAWWDRHGHTLPGAFLEGHARRYPQLAPALSAAASAAERLTGVPARSWLGSARVGGRGVAVAERLADWAQVGDRDQLSANISLVDGLLAPPGSARSFVERELSPRSGPALPHAAKVLARYAIALWRVRGGRRWAPAPVPPAEAAA